VCGGAEKSRRIIDESTRHSRRSWRAYCSGTLDMVTASSPRSVDTPARDHHILVCLDGSPHSEAALPYAISLARAFGSAVTLAHVLEPRHDHPGPQTTDPLVWEISRQEARGYLERQQHAVSAMLERPVEISLEQGHPAERIVALAAERGADLTILGSHGQGGITGWNLGSTVQQVLAIARGSVFVVHETSAPPRFAQPQRILVPLDGSIRTESVLPTAARIANAYGAELILVHVVREPMASQVLREGDDMELARQLAARLEKSAAKYLASVRGRLIHEVPGVRTQVTRHASEGQSLLELTCQDTDLVVLAAHGVGCDPARAFGSVAEHLLAHSRVPLLVLQDLPDELGRVVGITEQLAPPLRASYPPEAM
jgi:nucleotide-binding universal stress UspA family protein